MFGDNHEGGDGLCGHPLITDDTGTQGKGKAQLEFIGEYDHDSENGITTSAVVFPAIPVLSYGVAAAVDLVLGSPYEWTETKQDGAATREKGFSDASIEVKWRFYEKDGLSFAVKPGVTLPAGDENKGLGNGKASYHAFLITTMYMRPWAFHLNLGYSRDEHKLPVDEDANRKDIWHASLATQARAAENLHVAANIGVERNPDKTSGANPSFILCGLIYSVSENVDVDFGVKVGLNKPETDISYLPGIALKF